MQDKLPTNSKGKQHGYWESYYSDRHLMYKCYFINGVEYGYDESYWYSGKLTHKRYYAR